MPYSGGERSLATSMTPTAGIIVEVAKPQKRLNLPLAETLAILIALLTEALFSQLCFSSNIDKLVY